MTILIPVVGILCTTLFLLLWYPKQIKTGRLAALYRDYLTIFLKMQEKIMIDVLAPNNYFYFSEPIKSRGF